MAEITDGATQVKGGSIRMAVNADAPAAPTSITHKLWVSARSPKREVKTKKKPRAVPYR